MRLVHLLPSLGWGGAERVACTLHRLARTAGWTSQLDAPDLDVLRTGLCHDLGETPTVRPAERGLVGWALAARARVRALRPDVVHAHLPYPDRIAAVAVAAAGRPLVATFGLLPEHGRAWSPDELLRVRSDRTLAATARLLGRARFVAVSATDAATLARLVPAARLTHVANAPPLPPLAAPVRPAVPRPAGVVRLLSVGRLHPQKGFDRAIAALAREPVRSLAWHWVIAGDGDAHSTLARAIHDAGLAERVTFAQGYAASALFPSADLVLSPSRWEGLPLVPMEAVEAGLPVVCSDIAPHRELFGDIAAALLPPDERAWSASLATLIGAATARAALAKAQRHALPDDPRRRMWQAYAALYHDLAGVRS